MILSLFLLYLRYNEIIESVTNISLLIQEVDIRDMIRNTNCTGIMLYKILCHHLKKSIILNEELQNAKSFEFIIEERGSIGLRKMEKDI